MTELTKKTILRRLAKLTCVSTLFLIFAGGLVTSTGSGLSVPDWPLSYGMVFPPMVGGVFYEHGHRMIATVVGFLMLSLAILIGLFEKRSWVRNLAYIALGAVIIQGILGGITVKFFLPLWVSVCHGILAQTFLIMTVVLAYSFSRERENRAHETFDTHCKFLWSSLTLTYFIFIQLIIGAIMRHSHSGLAIPDFPTMGGEWWPRFDQTMLNVINEARFNLNLEPATMGQVVVHFLHRVGAGILIIALVALNFFSFDIKKNNINVHKSVLILNSLFIFQITLGIITVLSCKEYHITSLHVVTGALVLAWTTLLILRTAPLKLRAVKNVLLNKDIV
ncbi:MAG: COX15/CtaA family protein [Candidatus Omnitrophica bacterium]|nr:COX15/CtaA family protein [Candidatus Omnitrophota bacterium]